MGEVLRERSPRPGKHRESEARGFLKEREGRAAAGHPILPRADRVRYEEVGQDLREHYQTNCSSRRARGRRSAHTDSSQIGQIKRGRWRRPFGSFEGDPGAPGARGACGTLDSPLESFSGQPEVARPAAVASRGTL